MANNSQTKPDGSLSLLYKVPTSFPGEDPSPESIRSLIEEARTTFLANVEPPSLTPSVDDDENYEGGFDEDDAVDVHFGR